MDHGMKADRVEASGTGFAREGAAGDVSLEDTLQRLGERWAMFFALCSILAVVLIGILDALSGYEFGFSPFYLIPIMTASFCVGTRSGIATAVSATVAWYLADSYAGHPYAHSLAIYWNAGVRLLIFVLISLMLTRLKNNMQLERRQREKLVELNHQKNQFVGMAAHDLRTPLSVIWMCAESLQRRQGETSDRRQAESIEVILAKSGFMLRMVADLLDLSAIESGSLTLHQSWGDFGEFVRRHLEILRALAERKQLDLQFEGGALPTMWFDKDRIEQVFDNLIMNAVKFSPPHSVVTVSVSREGERVVTRVTDRGPGISSAELPQVFTAFKTTSVKPVGGEKGAGLGLAIVKKIVEAHGGEIGVTSVLGAGTTFFFTLPANCQRQDTVQNPC